MLDFDFDPYRSASGWYVAFSGGIDSMVLLHQICLLSSDQYSSYPMVGAIHVNHGLNEHADEWEAHCVAFCNANSVPLHIKRIRVKNSGRGTESAAREGRYKAFSNFLPSSSVLFTAHHLEDQVETFFLRLLRGSGIKGLSSIPAARPLGKATLVRPMLNLPRSKMEAYAIKYGITAIDDTSNQNLNFDRNFIRHQVLPLIETRWPAYRSTINRAISHLDKAFHSLEESLTEDVSVLSECGDPGLSVPIIKAMGADRAKMFVRRFLREHRLLMPDETSLNEFLRQILYGRNDSASELRILNHKMCRFREGVFLLPLFSENWSNDAKNLYPNTTIKVEGVGTICLQVNTDKSEISPQRLNATLCWRGSDIIVKSKRMRSKIKKILNARGIPPWWRDRIPIAVIDEKAIFIGNVQNGRHKPFSQVNAFLDWSVPEGIWGES